MSSRPTTHSSPDSPRARMHAAQPLHSIACCAWPASASTPSPRASARWKPSIAMPPRSPNRRRWPENRSPTMSDVASPRFFIALAVEACKLRRSLALVLAAVAPLLIAIFVFFNLIRVDKPAPWTITLPTSAAIWAFFMLPMSVTALTALVAHTEHGPRAWDHLRALPVPRWHLYASKAVCVLGVVAAMSLLLALLTVLAVEAAAVLKPAVAPLGAPDIGGYLG